MIQANVQNFADQDALWRMLCHVPESEFQPVAVFRQGEPQYTIIRQNGEQTAAPAADPLAHSDPAPSPAE
jgi:hypothetical protein